MAELIEHCSIITTKRFRQDLQRVKEQGRSVSGFIDIKHGNKTSVADYTVEYGAEFDYLVIHNEGVEQRIKLIDSELHFGARIWFLCECGVRVAKLHLPPGAREFKCRHCHKLAYASTGVNKNSRHGFFIYKQSQILKLIAKRESMGRIFYRSEYTRRFNKWLDKCDEVGLVGERVEAEELMRAIKG